MELVETIPKNLGTHHITMSTGSKSKGMFVASDGTNLMFTFILVSSLFLLWGLCNGMIDVMDKHFQDELSLTKSQSAWVQFAHYLGYFLMAMPAGWLASKLGYKGGIITGLLMVAAGGFWFLPATHINAMARAGHLSASTAFVGYLAGVCFIAAGLTFLETVANPYSTVLGPPRYAATRINLAQSCNGVGWIFGPIIGGLFFYSTDAAGRSTGSETLYIPYVIVAGVVLTLAVVFYFANVPDIKAEDDYHLDDSNGKGAAAQPTAGATRKVNRWLVYVFLVLNATVLIAICAYILRLIASACSIGESLVGLASHVPHPAALTITAENSLLVLICTAATLLTAITALAFIPMAVRISHHSMWSHPHFSAATLVQFLYVAAQAGIFSFFINYMTEDAPAVPASWRAGTSNTWFAAKTRDFIGVKTRVVRDDIKDLPALADRLKRKADPVSVFVSSQLSDETSRALTDYQGAASDPKPLLAALTQDLNKIVRQDPKTAKQEQLLYDPQRFSGIALGESTRQLLEKPEGENRARLNRLLLADAYPGMLAYHDGTLGITDKGAAMLASFGFLCFLFGRFSGAGLLRKFAAHKILGLYGLLNVVACLLIFLKLGWLSVACVFVSYFCMSIMFPTIFALGIFGLGA